MIMCNASVPVTNATVFIVANWTSGRSLVKNAGTTDNTGHYQKTVVFDAEIRPAEIQHMRLIFTNACDNTVGLIPDEKERKS